jgi:hypothetical protein
MKGYLKNSLWYIEILISNLNITTYEKAFTICV